MNPRQGNPEAERRDAELEIAAHRPLPIFAEVEDPDQTRPTKQSQVAFHGALPRPQDGQIQPYCWGIGG